MIRRAFLLATAERHFGLVLNLAIVAIVSRLMTPGEIGVYVLGSGLMMMVFSLREFATAEFLIQRRELTTKDVRTCFTLQMSFTLVIAAAVVALAPQLARSYQEEQLVGFFQLVAIAGIVEVFSLPIVAVLRRNMAFGAVTIINTAATASTGLMAILLAFLGFGPMSFAWAWLFGALSTLVLAQSVYRDLTIYKPSMSSWRDALTFGGYNGATIFLNRAYESIPQLILGSFLPLSAIGYYSRASALSSLADRLILASLPSVALPAFAAGKRDGHDLGPYYLQSTSYITVLHWPALVLYAILSYPIVKTVLGDQWLVIVPLTQVMAIAALGWFPCVLASSVLVAVGAMKDNLTVNLRSRPVAAVILCVASAFGPMAMALSQFVTIPIQGATALYFVHRHVHFAWQDLLSALAKSAAVTAFSAAGPLAVVIWTGWNFQLSVPLSVAAGAFAGIGWLIGIYATRHPFTVEIEKAAVALFGAGSGVLARTGMHIARWFHRHNAQGGWRAVRVSYTPGSPDLAERKAGKS